MNLRTTTEKFNLEFGGIPERPHEDAKHLLGKLFHLAKAAQTSDDIDIAHRKKSGGLICHFKTRTARDEVFGKRFELHGKSSKDLGFSETNSGLRKRKLKLKLQVELLKSKTLISNIINQSNLRMI